MKFKTSGELKYTRIKEKLYRTDAPWWVDTGITDSSFYLAPEDRKGLVGVDFKLIECIRMDMHGRLHTPAGVFWDGSSGPTIDGKADPAPSLMHDDLEAAIRKGKISNWRTKARGDAAYRDMLIQRGMTKARAYNRWFWLRARRIAGFGGRSKTPDFTQHVAN